MVVNSPKIKDLIALINKNRFNQFLKTSSAFLSVKNTRGIWEQNIENNSYIYYVHRDGRYIACFYLDKEDTLLFIPSTSDNAEMDDLVLKKIMDHFTGNHQAFLRFVHQKWKLVAIERICYINH